MARKLTRDCNFHRCYTAPLRDIKREINELLNVRKTKNFTKSNFLKIKETVPFRNVKLVLNIVKRRLNILQKLF